MKKRLLCLASLAVFAIGCGGPAPQQKSEDSSASPYQPIFPGSSDSDDPISSIPGGDSDTSGGESASSEASSQEAVDPNLRFYRTSESSDWCAVEASDLLRNHQGDPVDIVIPATYGGLPVEMIPYWGFKGCKIASVTMPDSIDYVGYSAFENCEYLTTVRLSNAIERIEQACFRGSGLTSIDFPAALTEIGPYAFAETPLTSVVLPESVEKYGEWIFYGCPQLVSVTIPASIGSIPKSMFQNCPSLTSVDIPEGVTEIGAYAFNGCKSLQTVSVPDSLRKIGEGAFLYCSSLQYTTEGDGLYFGNENNPYVVLMRLSDKCLEEVTIRAEVRVLNLNVSYYRCGTIVVDPNNIIYDSRDNCGSVIETATNTLILPGLKGTIPDSVTAIGDYAFSTREDLTSFKAPPMLESIGSYAFRDTPLIYLELSSNLKSIGSYAFQFTDIQCVNFNGAVPEDINIRGGNGAFENAPKYGYLSHHAFTLGEAGDSYVVSGYNVTPYGHLDIPCMYDGLPVTEIGRRVYAGTAHLESIDLPDSIVSIGEGAFTGSSALTSARLSENLTSIGDFAFYNTKALKRIVIPASVASIGENSFELSGLNRIYYGGTYDQWREISIAQKNDVLLNALRFVYSEEEPTGAGAYWHYVDGVPTEW